MLSLLTVVAEVGHRDVLVTFAVKDANTRQPIPNASVHVRAEGSGFCQDRDADDFALVCDAAGHASQLAKSCMWSSTHGPFVNDFAIHLPHWWYSASAPGYARCDELFLDDGTSNRTVKPEQPVAKLEVTVLLSKSLD